MRDIATVRTPENVEFELERASVATRGLAWGIDAVVLATAMAAIYVPLSLIGAFSEALSNVAAIVAVFVIQWGYGFGCDAFARGRSVGKRVLGLRVVDRSGLRITPTQAAVRNLLRVVDSLPVFYLVGAVSMLLDPEARRLGDLAAGTIVVRERVHVRPPARDRGEQRRVDPTMRLAVRAITDDERAVMIALGTSRDSLPLHVRHELFERLAGHLEARLGLTKPPHLSAENFVLEVQRHLA